ASHERATLGSVQGSTPQQRSDQSRKPVNSEQDCCSYADCLRRGVALYRRQHGLSGKVRLTAAISIGPAIEVEDNGIARACGRNEKPEISGGAVRLHRQTGTVGPVRAKPRLMCCTKYRR